MKKNIIVAAVLSALVAGTAPAQAPRFSRDTSGSGQPVVVDAKSGLTWQGCAAGQSGDACTGSPAMNGWRAASSYCEGLEWAGHSDWRLPANDELSGIVDRSRQQPAIDTAAFPATGNGWFWTSSAYTSNPDVAWAVFFHDGSATVVDKKIRFFVRCVRASK